MPLTQAIVLGLIQGLTEFLPISSSAHLIFLPKLFGWADQGLTFDAVVHLGTLLAVIVYFRQKLFGLVRSFFQRDPDSLMNRRLALILLLTVIPAGLAGALGGEWIEQHTRSATLIAWGLIGWGIMLFLADRYSQKQKQPVDINHLSWKKIATIAGAQALALIPGTSRSGITMTAGLFLKLNKKSAAEFSFLMSVLVIALVGGAKFFELMQNGLGNLTASVIFTGFVTSALSGFLAIAFLLKIIQKWNFTPFVVYRICVGIILLLFL